MKESARILLVDDDSAGAELTVAVLAEMGLAGPVRVLGDGEEALEYLLGSGRYASEPPGRPDILLLDLKMPKVDGHEVLRRVRMEPALAGMRVVILTSSDQERDIALSRELGTDAYVVKPVGIDELMARLRGLGSLWDDAGGSGEVRA